MTILRRLRKIARERKQTLKNIGIKVVEKPCKWPIGDVGSKDFHFCCEEALPGRSPYCAKHTKLAYIRAPSAHTKNQKTILSQIRVI